jgi:hypothetical protein
VGAEAASVGGGGRSDGGGHACKTAVSRRARALRVLRTQGRAYNDGAVLVCGEAGHTAACTRRRDYTDRVRA